MNQYLIGQDTLIQIADAIRSKTGNNLSLLPGEFPDEIRSISGGGTAGSYQLVKNAFRPDADSVTVYHTLGVKPDILLIWADHSVTSGKLNAALGFSSEMVTGFGSGWWGFVSSDLSMHSTELGFENDQENQIRNVTGSAFTVGGVNYPLNQGKNYYYAAIGGITG